MTQQPIVHDWSWLAGILEGEGCFSIFQRKGAKHKSIAILCEMSDEWTIRKLQEVSQEGTVIIRPNMVRKDGRKRKQTWIWSVQNHRGILNVLEKVTPFLSPRRSEKCNELLSYIQSRNS